MNNRNNGDWKHIYARQLDKIGGTLIFESNINTKDFKNTFKIESNFLDEIIQAWLSINFNENTENIKKEIIWNNTNIKNDN